MDSVLQKSKLLMEDKIEMLLQRQRKITEMKIDDRNGEEGGNIQSTNNGYW